MKISKILLLFSPIWLIVLIVSVLLLSRHWNRLNTSRVLENYARINVGMGVKDVIHILGMPSTRVLLRTDELGEGDKSWDITMDMITELKTKYKEIVKYIYLIKKPPSLLNIKPITTGIEIYVDETSKTVILVNRLH